MLNSPIEEIKSRLDIVEVISSYIKLQKCGVNYRARCPFHSEKKASFFVSPRLQIFKCFGCGASGDIFKFIMMIEGIEFPDALKLLAQKAGVQLKPISPELKTQRQRLYEICELACKFFEKQLQASKSGKEAKKYLLGRKINEQSIKEWRLGYAPDKPNALGEFLTSKGYKMEEIKKAGLVTQSEGGKYFDRFRSRIIFPIFDLNSQAIAFGGRIFGPRAEKEIAKYVNTPATLLYDKSKTLYGLHRAKLELHRKNFCILVEGYTDCIMAHQAGFENTVAVSGTALTSLQLKILKRYTENLVSAFDMDVAGNSATKRGIEMAQAMDFNVKVVTMPEGKDPADIIAKDPALWEKLVKGAKSIFDFYFESAFSKFDKSTPDGKKEISKMILPVIKRIPNKIVQSHWIQRLAQELGTKEENIEEELRKTKIDNTEIREPEADNNVSEKKAPKSRKEKLEEQLISLVARKPELHRLINKEELQFLSERTRNIISKIKEFFKNEQDFKNYSQQFSLFKESISSQDFDLIASLILSKEIEEKSETDDEKETLLCLKGIKEFDIKEQLAKVAKQIKEVEAGKDFKKTEELIKKFHELAQKLNQK